MIDLGEEIRLGVTISWCMREIDRYLPEGGNDLVGYVISPLYSNQQLLKVLVPVQ